MKTSIKTIKTIAYKGHTIRVCEAGISETVLIDNDADELEEAPIYKQDNELEYASVADAKRMINGQEPKAILCYIADIPWLRERFYARFAKKTEINIHPDEIKAKIDQTACSIVAKYELQLEDSPAGSSEYLWAYRKLHDDPEAIKMEVDGAVRYGDLFPRDAKLSQEVNELLESTISERVDYYLSDYTNK